MLLLVLVSTWEWERKEGRTSMRIVFLKARMSAGLLSRIGYCSSMNLVVSERLTCMSLAHTSSPTHVTARADNVTEYQY